MLERNREAAAEAGSTTQGRRSRRSHDLSARDRKAECPKQPPRGAMTTPTGKSFWGRAFLLQTLFKVVRLAASSRTRTV